MGNDKFLTAIFWVLGNEIFLFKELVEPDYRGISDYPFMHADKWQEVIQGQPALKDKKYCDVPRGRMTYSKSDGIYHIAISSQLIKNKKLFEELLKKMGMTADKVTVSENPFY